MWKHRLITNPINYSFCTIIAVNHDDNNDWRLWRPCVLMTILTVLYPDYILGWLTVTVSCVGSFILSQHSVTTGLWSKRFDRDFGTYCVSNEKLEQFWEIFGFLELKHQLWLGVSVMDAFSDVVKMILTVSLKETTPASFYRRQEVVQSPGMLPSVWLGQVLYIQYLKWTFIRINVKNKQSCN